jgi:lipid-binding SYLF domain-containing protein
MKTTIGTCAALLVSVMTLSASISSSDVKRLSESATVVRDFRAIPDKGIPEDLWNRAECVSVIPSLKKAAFVIGGEFGRGVITCRSGATWSAPLFIELEKGSAGFQIGAEQVDLVLMMMNRTGVEKLLSDKINLGGDASIAAGPVGRAASASTDGRLSAEILAYSRAQGVFAGINLSGGVLRPDKKANADAYGPSVAYQDVLFKRDVATPPAAQAFLRTLGTQPTATGGER